MSKLRFRWRNLHDPSLCGKTRWISWDLMKEKDIIEFISRWQFVYRDYDFFLEKVDVEDPTKIDEAKAIVLDVLDRKTKRLYQRMPA